MKLVEKMVMLRKAKGLTQLQVAEKINVSRQAISKWESGSAVPSINNLKYLAELFMEGTADPDSHLEIA